MPKVSEIWSANAENALDAGWPPLSLGAPIESTVHRRARQRQLRIRAMLGAAHSAAGILPNRT